MDNCPDHSAHKIFIEQHDKRLSAHGDEIDELKECVVRLTALQEAHTAWQANADERLAALESKPGKRWESVTNYAISAVLGLLFGLFVSQIGIGG